MLDRIAELLFKVCFFVAPASIFFYVIGLSDALIYPAVISTLVIAAFAAYGFVTSYKELTKLPPPAENTSDDADAPTKNDSPATIKDKRKWHLITMRLNAGLMIFGVMLTAIGMFGESLVPFILSFSCIFAAIVIALMSTQGVFERMDNKRNEKRYPKPPRKPAPPLPKLPPKPRPEDLPGYQYSFEF